MLRKFLTDERGQSMVEYTLLLVLIAAVAAIVLTSMGASVSCALSKIQATTQAGGDLLDVRPEDR